MLATLKHIYNLNYLDTSVYNNTILMSYIRAHYNAHIYSRSAPYGDTVGVEGRLIQCFHTILHAAVWCIVLFLYHKCYDSSYIYHTQTLNNYSMTLDASFSELFGNFSIL